MVGACSLWVSEMSSSDVRRDGREELGTLPQGTCTSVEEYSATLRVDLDRW